MRLGRPVGGSMKVNDKLVLHPADSLCSTRQRAIGRRKVFSNAQHQRGRVRTMQQSQDPKGVCFTANSFHLHSIHELEFGCMDYHYTQC